MDLIQRIRLPISFDARLIEASCDRRRRLKILEPKLLQRKAEKEAKKKQRRLDGTRSAGSNCSCLQVLSMHG